jgi:hypothetical protein
MRFIFLAAFAAIMLGLAAMTMGNAVTPGNSPWGHHTNQDNGQG